MTPCNPPDSGEVQGEGDKRPFPLDYLDIPVGPHPRVEHKRVMDQILDDFVHSTGVPKEFFDNDN